MIATTESSIRLHDPGIHLHRKVSLGRHDTKHPCMEWRPCMIQYSVRSSHAQWGFLQLSLEYLSVKVLKQAVCR